MKRFDFRLAHRRQGLLLACFAAVAAFFTGCKTPPAPTPAPAPAALPKPPVPSTQEGVIGPIPSTEGSARRSAAATPRAYRADAATHLYGLNASRVYKGKLPPLLYAVGVLNVEIDRVGRVTRLEWLRAPRHAPEVMAEIERTVRSASPFPVPSKMGKVVYTDTWLWHQSGQFQLDTLTEGQL